MAENRVIPRGAVSEFREEMGWTTRELSTEIGASRRALLNWDRNGAPLYIGLAFSAKRKKLAPYKGTATVDRELERAITHAEKWRKASKP